MPVAGHLAALMSKVSALALLLVAALLLAEGSAPASDVSQPSLSVPERMEEWRDGLEMLHSGRIDAALQWFLARHRAQADNVCGYYYSALVLTNFTLEGPLPEELASGPSTMLDRGIDLGEALRQSGVPDTGQRFCLGALYALRAQQRLKASHYLHGAFDAKRSRRLMLDLLVEEPGFIDCHFWLGSYEYFAAVFPKIVKFIRRLLFLPGGDRRRGLEALQRVTHRGILERYNASWILYHAYWKYEKDEAAALDALKRFHAVYPESVEVSLKLAERYARKTPPDHEAGIRLKLDALESVETEEFLHSGLVAARIKLSLAKSYLENLRPEAAVEVLRPLHRDLDGERRTAVALTLVGALARLGLQEEAMEIVRDARRRDPGSSALPALQTAATLYDRASAEIYQATLPARRLARRGRIRQAEASFRELVSVHGSVAQIHYWMADMYFTLGRDAAAEARYREVIRQGAAHPRFMLPVAYLRVGNLMDLAGRRREARLFYRQAVDSAGEFESTRDEAQHYLKQPFDR